ncbi:MAG: HNH endonuclease, partial [Sciscionella sp.]
MAVPTRRAIAQTGTPQAVPTDGATLLDPPAQPPWGKRQVLLLNATFEPLTALPLRRAVVLMVRGKAEVVHE